MKEFNPEQYKAESVEGISTPEISTEELLALLDGIKVKDYKKFVFNGINFLIILTDNTSESDNHSPGSYYQSTLIDGYDIYLLRGLSKEEQKRVLFHEILEACFREQNISNRDAHNRVLEEEVKCFGERQTLR